MSKLQIFGRQYVVFDARNKDHRRWFADFNKNLTWAKCPVRFVVNDDAGDLITMIQRSLIQYYVDQEFITKVKTSVNKKTAPVKRTRKLTSK